MHPRGDLYARLGVRRDASRAAIRRAYLRLAKRLHPDVNPARGAHEEFLAVKEAYEVLSSPLLRREYDERVRNRAPAWANPPPARSPARVIRVAQPFVVREPRAVRPVADERRGRQLAFAYTAMTAGMSIAFLGGAFLLVALGGLVPGIVSFAMGLILVLLLLHVLPSSRLR